MLLPPTEYSKMCKGYMVKVKKKNAQKKSSTDCLNMICNKKNACNVGEFLAIKSNILKFY